MLALAACGGGDDAAAPTTTTAGPAPTEAPSATANMTASTTIAAAPTTAAALAETEPALREPSTTATQFERPGKAQQVTYRQLVANPGWLEDGVRRLPSAWTRWSGLTCWPAASFGR